MAAGTLCCRKGVDSDGYDMVSTVKPMKVNERLRETPTGTDGRDGCAMVVVEGFEYFVLYVVRLCFMFSSSHCTDARALEC